MLSGIYVNRESAKPTGILDAISLHYAGLAQLVRAAHLGSFV